MKWALRQLVLRATITLGDVRGCCREGWASEEDVTIFIRLSDLREPKEIIDLIGEKLLTRAKGDR